MSGIKHDSGKPRLGLLPSQPLKEIAAVLTFGAIKYEAHNWRKGFKWSRLVDASLRHLTAWNEGQDKDEESGLSHLAHAACCLLFLLEHEAKGLGEDDRYREAPPELKLPQPGGIEKARARLQEQVQKSLERLDDWAKQQEGQNHVDSPGGRAAKSKCP